MMLNRRTAALLLGGTLGLAPVLAAHGRDSEHPLIGSWTWKPEGKDCTEVYEWRANGTGHVVSGKEVTETRFKISATPDDKGYYVFLDEVVKDNKGRDCAGSTKDNTGEKSTLFIQISPAKDQIRICVKPSDDACFGPLTRVPVVEI